MAMGLLQLPSTLRRVAFGRCASILTTRGYSTAISTPPHEYRPPYFPESKPDASTELAATTTTLNSYNVSIPPNALQLRYASAFFHTAPPKILFSAAHFRSFPPSPFPEVAFLGRSNVGKSSLLNALFGRTKAKDAHVSKRPGRTKTMNGFGVTGGLAMGAAPVKEEKVAAWKQFPMGGLVVVDMPGYGSGSREVWGTEALKYLEQRKQLRRTFVLVDSEVGLKKTDITILTHLRRKGISHQIVLSKVDKLLGIGTKVPGPVRLSNKLRKLQDICAQIRVTLDAEADDGKRGVGDILCCSAEKTLESRGHRKIGIDEVRWSVLSACGMESDIEGQRRRQRLEEINVLDDDA